jgi:tetratricopeptide (TPR) repeat protein
MPLRINASAASGANGRQKPVAAATPPPPDPGLPFGLPYPPSGTAQKPAGVSLCMIVKNEEEFLPKCLQSIAGVVDEINVVDTGSTDRTIEIAKSFGARVEHREWRNDFAWARNEALAMATKRWILVLDADEVLNPDVREIVIGMKTVPAHLMGLWVRCFNLADDYKGTGASSHALARMFPNNPRVRYRSPIHEFISLDQNITGLDCKPSSISITHYGYLKGIVDDRDKGKRNLEIIKAATEREAEEPFHWYNLGITSLIIGDRRGAISALEKMLELVGERPRGFVPVGLSTLAEAYAHEGENEKAVWAANESLRRSPQFCNAHFSLGRALSNMKRYEEAREAFLQAIADGPYNTMQFVCDDEVSVWKAYSEIGHTYAQEGNAALALEWFEKGLANRPSAQPLLLNRARALEAGRRLDEAEAQFRDVYRDFGDQQSLFDYLNCLLRRKKLGEALEVILKAVNGVGPTVAVQLMLTAATIADNAGWGGSEGYLRRALTVAPGSAAVLDELEKRYLARGDTAAVELLHVGERNAPCIEPEDFARRSARLLVDGDAQSAFERALEGLDLKADHSRLLYQAGLAGMVLGRKEEALARLTMVKPDDPFAFGRATYLRAILLHDAGKHGEALIALDTVLAATPGDVDASLCRAKVLEALGRRNEVEATLRRALPSGGQRIATELALHYMRVGEFEKARVTAEEALATA